jgi:hypothetical protein
MALEVELATYHRELPALLPHAGKYALVHQDQISGLWATYSDALQEGYRLFGLDPFLVKKVQAAEAVHRFTRGVEPVCRS